MANSKVVMGVPCCVQFLGFCCSLFASGKCWKIRRVVCKICPMSIPLAEQSIFFGVCVTFAGCHILGMAPSDPPQGLAWRNRP